MILNTVSKITLAGALGIASVAIADNKDGDLYGHVYGGYTLQSQLKSIDIDAVDVGGGLFEPVIITKKRNTPGYRFGAAIGQSFGDFRGELELTHMAKKQNVVITDNFSEITIPEYEREITIKTKTQATAAMANGYYDLKVNDMFTPYVGMGLGLARVKHTESGILADEDGGVERYSASHSDNRFAYQAIAGAKFDVADGVAVTADYRHFGAKHFRNNHSFNLGVMVNFG